MIRELHIQNFALIDKLSVSFSEGLSILTGETGAGKSIILGALNMILGERADTDLIRQGADKAIAEAILWTGEHAVVEELLREAEIEVRSELILRREIRAAGSRAFINDTPVPVQLLKKVGDLLVDLHGQHEHQLLLREEEHREVVDRFKAVRGAKVAYVEAFEELSALKRELAAVRKREAQLKEKSELYRFQLKELSEVKLVEGEEEEMQAEMRLLDNAEDLQMKAGMISAIGTSEDGGLLELLGKMRGLLEDLADIEPRFEEYVAEMKSAKITLEDIVSFAENYRDQVEFDPQRLEFLRRRQSELQRLQKKYTRTHGELMEYEEFLKQELDAAVASDSRGEELETMIVKKTRVLRDAAVSLHEARVRQGALFSAQIVERLAQLGIPHGAFEVEVEWLEDSAGWIEVGSMGTGSGSGAFRVACEPYGADNVRFLISTNKGESPKPLSKIASGGEISRVMLALKSIMASEESLPVMIFDEIDTGISGSVSEMVGKVMRALSDRCQIIAITHQPQIASQAHQHYRVEKREEADRTVTRISALSEEEHVIAVARLMSGADVTESTMASAREMIKANRN